MTTAYRDRKILNFSSLSLGLFSEIIQGGFKPSKQSFVFLESHSECSYIINLIPKNVLKA